MTVLLRRAGSEVSSNEVVGAVSSASITADACENSPWDPCYHLYACFFHANWDGRVLLLNLQGWLTFANISCTHCRLMLTALIFWRGGCAFATVVCWRGRCVLGMSICWHGCWTLTTFSLPLLVCCCFCTLYSASPRGLDLWRRWHLVPPPLSPPCPFSAYDLCSFDCSRAHT